MLKSKHYASLFQFGQTKREFLIIDQKWRPRPVTTTGDQINLGYRVFPLSPPQSLSPMIIFFIELKTKAHSCLTYSNYKATCKTCRIAISTLLELEQSQPGNPSSVRSENQCLVYLEAYKPRVDESLAAHDHCCDLERMRCIQNFGCKSSQVDQAVNNKNIKIKKISLLTGYPGYEKLRNKKTKNTKPQTNNLTIDNQKNTNLQIQRREDR